MLNNILNSLKSGSLTLAFDPNNIINMNNMVIDYINKDKNNIQLSDEELNNIDKIIEISYIIWDNTDRSILPLESGIFDTIIVLYKKYRGNYRIGGTPIQFTQSAENIDNSNLKKSPFVYKDNSKLELFGNELLTTPKITKEDFYRSPFIYKPKNISKRVLDQKHMYPELVGTLDKAKYVLNIDAERMGVINDSNVTILERDFFAKHIEAGILDPNRVFYIVAELKYDGVSVEAEVSNKIHKAGQRGDTEQGLTSDVTDKLINYKFKHAKQIPEDNKFGMQFEAIMTYDNLYRYNEARGQQYKNCRTAISSIFNSLDGYLYTDYITLVPLKTSLTVDRLTEIQFMNKYYHSGEQLRYAVIKGNYIEVLFQIRKFMNEAEYLRDYLNFMYDGIVISYIEPDLIDTLGRENHVNKYSIAVKFSALKKYTLFTGYKYSVGQNGVITPMIYYNPVEFYGTIHDHSSGHSFDRFNKLQLRLYDILCVEYVNDVMPYPSKPECDHNDNNTNPIIPFITHCPSCGNELKVSKSGKSIICDNIKCPERNLKRMAGFIDKLNLKDFAEDRIENISVYNLTQLLNLTQQDVISLGEETSKKFMQRMDELKHNDIYDYKIIGALGFTDVAEEKWKLILNKYSLEEVMNMDINTLKSNLLSIKGIGPVTVDTITTEFEFFMEDLLTVMNMKNIIVSKGMAKSKSIRFTGVRDSELETYLNSLGYDANGKAGVTKTTDILIIPNEGYSSPKTVKAIENNHTIIVSLSEFRNNINKYL